MPARALHTIGYEGSSIDDFLVTLERVGIDLLIDVRDVPISRKKGFSKNRLSTALQSKGINYLHLKGLGDPKPGRIAAREGRFADFRRIFTVHLQSTVAEEDMARGIAAVRESHACLMCFERDHHNCHRCIVAEEMVRRGGFRLIHLAVNSTATSQPKLGRAGKDHAAAIHIG